MEDFFRLLPFNASQPLVFNSVFFFIIFSVFYFLYSASFTSLRLRNIILLLFSIYFYYKVSGYAVFLLLLMASSDFFIGKAIHSAGEGAKRKLLLWISLFINIGALGYFKYTLFILQTWSDLFGGGTDVFVHIILLPVGISFFVFKSLSYIFDIYNEVIAEPEKNYLTYLLYVSFFPNILAGPIAKAKDLLPQFSKPIVLTDEFIGKGFFFIMSGAFKKFFIADFLAVNFLDRVFTSPNLFTGFENAIATYGAAIHLYCDFSGYTDMMIGFSFLLGFTVKNNFNQPFMAVNVSDFWKRWHITLSNWLNDYVFYPLSYTFRSAGKPGIIFAVIITFVISGLWHGAAWTFVLWGIAHGIMIAFDVVTENTRIRIEKSSWKKAYRFISIFITFHFVALSIVLFKAADFSTALVMYGKIFGEFNFSLAGEWYAMYKTPFLLMVFAYILHYLPTKWFTDLCDWFVERSLISKALIVTAWFVLIFQAVSSEALPFVYLKF